MRRVLILLFYVLPALAQTNAESLKTEEVQIDPEPQKQEEQEAPHSRPKEEKDKIEPGPYDKDGTYLYLPKVRIEKETP